MAIKQGGSSTTSPRNTGRAARADGDNTRQQIIEIAGQIFSEQGYQGTTSKQICEQCGCNIAAVNYHFGSRDGLYSEVLIESHRRFISMDALMDINNSGLDSRSKLARIIDALIDGIDFDHWHSRLFVREIMAPSEFIEGMLNAEAIPKFSIVRHLISDITGIDEKDSSMPLYLLSTIAPCFFLLAGNRATTSKVLGNFWQNKDALKAHLKAFLFAGLDAAKAQKITT